MSFCVDCGSAVLDDAKNCPKCGKEITRNQHIKSATEKYSQPQKKNKVRYSVSIFLSVIFAMAAYFTFGEKMVLIGIIVVVVGILGWIMIYYFIPSFHS